MSFKERWRDAAPWERLCTVLYLLLNSGALLLYLLYLLRVLPYNAKTFAWILFAPSFFLSALLNWNKNRERAVQDIFICSIASMAAVIGFLSFLLTL